jgi:glycosyltransferase involved in cell wall biosynthesis
VRRLLPGGGEPAAQRMAERIEKIRHDEHVDAVIFSGRRTDAALAALDGLPVVVDMCDATSLRLEREMEVARPSRRAVLEMHVRRVRQTERLMMARADRLFFASPRDLEALMPDATPDRLDHAAIIPNGVDTAFWSRSSPTLGTDEIVLTGAMSYGPNVDASVRLAESILPLVRREVPSARLTVVGRDPAPAVTALARLDGVTVTGYVDDVRPYLDRAAVFAAPLRFGAGIQNKLLEAMAMAVPSVVSALAADGLRTVDGAMPPVAIAEGDAEIAAEIVRVLRRVVDDPQPDEAARAYVHANFSWARSGETLAGLVSGALLDRATV